MEEEEKGEGMEGWGKEKSGDIKEYRERGREYGNGRMGKERGTEGGKGR